VKEQSAVSVENLQQSVFELKRRKITTPERDRLIDDLILEIVGSLADMEDRLRSIEALLPKNRHTPKP
jgi:hypothetical protein